jgi:uncharacterized protein (TIGR00369 family)
MIAPDGFEDRVRNSFAAQNMMATLNVSCTEVAAGHVVFTMPFSDAFTQQDGFLHAGAITTVLDSACGYAAFTLMPEGARVLTIEFKANFLAPSRGERFRIVGEVVKAGRTITIAEGRAYGISAAGEKLCATMTGTLMTLLGDKSASG